MEGRLLNETAFRWRHVVHEQDEGDGPTVPLGLKSIRFVVTGGLEGNQVIVSLGTTHMGESVEGNTGFWPKRGKLLNGVDCTVVTNPVPAHVEKETKPSAW